MAGSYSRNENTKRFINFVASLPIQAGISTVARLSAICHVAFFNLWIISVSNFSKVVKKPTSRIIDCGTHKREKLITYWPFQASSSSRYLFQISTYKQGNKRLQRAERDRFPSDYSRASNLKWRVCPGRSPLKFAALVIDESPTLAKWLSRACKRRRRKTAIKWILSECQELEVSR